MIDVSFSQAFDLVMRWVTPLPEESVAVEHSLGRAVSREITSLVDSPSADVSLKDGYALVARDIAQASYDKPVTLELLGAKFAGDQEEAALMNGKAVKVTSGALIPLGADGVLSNEFALQEGSKVNAFAPVGNNILKKGTDVRAGEVLVPKHTTLIPSHAGLIAAAGHATVWVHRKPRVTIIASGDEIVGPGEHIGKGKVAASNIVTISAWCKHYQMETKMTVVGDSAEAIKRAIEDNFASCESIIISGGAWKSERDLVVRVLDGLGWRKIFQRVKIGPGKAVAFGLLDSKPVFCLPGGPPSNQMAFLHLALPGLLRLAGHEQTMLPALNAVLTQEVGGQKDWTQFHLGQLGERGDFLEFVPQKLPSRLQMLSRADGVICVPEGIEVIPAGSTVKVFLMGALRDIRSPRNETEPPSAGRNQR